jgi:UPF0271 protein
LPLVDLNIDLGELPGEPADFFRIATVVNVACGGHAGDEESMRACLRAAKASRASVAAHPSYADREGFGRRRGQGSAEEVRRVVREQCEELVSLAGEEGIRVGLCKLHGGLYHDAASDPVLAATVASVVRDALGQRATLVGPAGSALAAAAHAAGLSFSREGFADRGLDEGGALLPRGVEGALVTDPSAAAAQAMRLVEAGEVDTVCVHGDTPGALEIARAVRASLESRGWLRRRV